MLTFVQKLLSAMVFDDNFCLFSYQQCRYYLVLTETSINQNMTCFEGEKKNRKKTSIRSYVTSIEEGLNSKSSNMFCS